MNYVAYFSNAGVPAVELTPTIVIYKKVADGADVIDPPAVTELGGGFYKFAATPAEALVVQLDGGDSLPDTDRYKVVQITANDGDLDAAISSRAVEAGGNLAAVKVQTDKLPDNPANEATVETHVDSALATYGVTKVADLLTALNAYDPPTKAEMDAAITSLGTLTVVEILSGDLSDNQTFPVNSLADLIRKLFWFICNRMDVVNETGVWSLFKTDDNTIAANGTFSDNGTLTRRSIPNWQE
jgi:hypothetical protein